MYEINDSIVLNRPLVEVFEFFSQARNLERLTPDFLNFHILTPEPIEMRKGLLIDYKLRVRGIPIRWQSEISEWNPPYAFTDEQRRGPYRKWIHRHTFEAMGENETRVTDHVRYSVWGGALVNRFFVRPDVEMIFAYRREQMERLFA